LTRASSSSLIGHLDPESIFDGDEPNNYLYTLLKVWRRTAIPPAAAPSERNDLR
jgi:hypothetical protein